MYHQCEDARKTAQDVLDAVSQLDIKINRETIHITVSIGMVTAQKKSHIFSESLIQQADDCLYRAKSSGRNIAVCEEFATK